MPRNATSKRSSKTSQRSSSKPALQDALQILTADHKKVIQMFDEFAHLKEENPADEETKQLLIETACAELTIHAQVEEELFYPAAREVIDDMNLLDEAEVEHGVAKQLITELAAMEPDDDLYEAKFTVLGEYVKHHIQEEEKKLFSKLNKAEIDLDELGEEIRQRKLELRTELGIPSGEETEGEEFVPLGTSTRRNVH